MITKYILPTFIAITMISGTKALAAPDSLGHKYPRVVLVQLPAEKNKMEALTKARRYADAEEVKDDAAKTRAAMINDFHDHFNYCPVYYYIDTNADAVKEKHFEGILFNADMSVVEKPMINAGSTDYSIVYYGYPNEQMRKDVVASEVQGAPNAGRGLVVLNDKYQQIAYAAVNEYAEGSDRRNRKSNYAYVSRHFDIRYIPFAGKYYAALSGRDELFKGHVKKKQKRRK